MAALPPTHRPGAGAEIHGPDGDWLGDEQRRDSARRAESFRRRVRAVLREIKRRPRSLDARCDSPNKSLLLRFWFGFAGFLIDVPVSAEAQNWFGFLAGVLDVVDDLPVFFLPTNIHDLC